MSAFVAMELDISPADVRSMVLGGHGDSMVPLPRFTSVNGVPIGELLPAERIEAIAERTRNGGGEIVGLLQTLSGFYAPGAAAAVMVEAILTGKGRLVAASVWAEGEYGISETFVGLPVIVGAGGLREVVELELEGGELEALVASAAGVKEGIRALDAEG